MSATYELRKLLDERGVKWWETINHANCIFTWWDSPTFGTVHAMDNEDGETLFMACLNNCDFTPEQAIAATLGNSRAERTCKQEERGWGTEGDHARVWLTCGHDCMVPTVQDLPNYCPNCGARVGE